MNTLANHVALSLLRRIKFVLTEHWSEGITDVATGTTQYQPRFILPTGFFVLVGVHFGRMILCEPKGAEVSFKPGLVQPR